jgi:DNA-binding CsgD family transcriptional regulator
MQERVFMGIRRVCYAGLDSVTLRQRAAERLATAMPIAAYAFATTDPDTALLNHMVSDRMPSTMARHFVEHLYPDEGARFAMRAMRQRRTVFPVDELPPEFPTCMREHGYPAGTHMVLADGKRMWGMWCVMREGTQAKVLRRERAFLARLVPHLTRGLERAALLDVAAEGGADAAVGVLVLDAVGRVALRTAAIVPMLDDLADVGVDLTDGVPLCIVNCTLRLRHAAASREPDSPGDIGLRARGRSGRWYRLHASLAEPNTDGRSRIIVTVRPLEPRERGALLTALYGLSPRESEVAAACARGETTKEIASALGVSPHTVKEHLDRACEKVGARGRRALVARLFVDAYLPALREAKGRRLSA